MNIDRLYVVLFLFLTGSLQGTVAQTKNRNLVPLQHHAVRSINPADSTFTDLEFLTKEIGEARVIFLGEPTHGEGNVSEAKARLIRFLHQRLGFTTVAFESGFYEMHQAQQAIDAGQNVREALGQGVFGVWTSTQEFQPTIDLIRTQKLRVAGFDPQLNNSDYTDELVDELQQFVGPANKNDNVYDVLEAGISFMAESNYWSPAVSYEDYRLASNLLTGKLQSIARKDPKRRAQAEFWVQCLASLLEQGRYYRELDPGAKTEHTFQAQDSNPRDAQMAANLLFYVQQHPKEKIICWGASAHFANRPAALANEELQLYKPMGGIFKAKYKLPVYLLAMTTAGGYYRSLLTGDTVAVPAPAPGSIEAQLAALPAAYSFINLRANFGTTPMTSYAMTEYAPMTGNWSDVFDGLLFLRTVTPTHPVVAPPAAARPDSLSQPRTATANQELATSSVSRSAPPPASRASRGPQKTIRGTVLDAKTGEAIVFASIQVAGTTAGTVSDARGAFSLTMPAAETVLHVSFIGYEFQQVRLPGPSVQIKLVPRSYALAEVSVSAEKLNARKLLTRALRHVPANYEQRDYNMSVYGRSVATNYDTLVQDVEHVSTLYNQRGYQDRQGTTARLREVKWNKQAQAQAALAGGFFLNEGVGIITRLDVLSLNPLFKVKKLKHFNLSLGPVEQHENAEVVVINFTSKRKSHAATGQYYMRAYSGKVYVNMADYAIVKCELLWERDTAIVNSQVRRYFPRGGTAAADFHILAAEQTIRQTASYTRHASGAYTLEHTFMEWLEKGRDLATQQPVDIRSGVSLQLYGLTTTPVEVVVNEPRSYEEMLSFKDKIYHEQFWQTFKRPPLSTIK